jgi:hypothetical protein
MAHDLKILLQLRVGLVESFPLPLLGVLILGLSYAWSARLRRKGVGRSNRAWGLLCGWPGGRVCNLAPMISSSPQKVGAAGRLTGLAKSTAILDMRIKDLLKYLTALDASSCDL